MTAETTSLSVRNHIVDQSNAPARLKAESISPRGSSSSFHVEEMLPRTRPRSVALQRAEGLARGLCSALAARQGICPL